MIKFKCKDYVEVLAWWMEKNSEVLVIIKFWPWSYSPNLSIKLENCVILEFLFIHCKLWKSVKIINFKCKNDLEVFSWWMEQNLEVLIFIKFRPRSHTRTLAEIFKLTNFEVCFYSLWSCECQSKWSNSKVKMIYKCFLD